MRKRDEAPEFHVSIRRYTSFGMDEGYDGYRADVTRLADGATIVMFGEWLRWLQWRMRPRRLRREFAREARYQEVARFKEEFTVG